MGRFAGQAGLLLALEVLVWDRSEVLFLAAWFPAAEVAFYTVPFNVAAHLLLLPRVLASSAEATLLVHHRQDPARTARVTATAIRLIALFAIPAALGLAAVSGPVITVIYRADYAPAIPVLALLALFTVARALQLPAVSLIVAADRQSFLVALGLGLGALLLLASWLVVPGAGALGAAAVKGGVQVAGAVALWTYLHRRLGVRAALGPLVRVSLVSLVMFVAVRALVMVLPPLAGLLVAVPVGMVVVLVGLRILACIQPEDRDRLVAAAAMLPLFARDPFVAALHLLAPPRRQVPRQPPNDAR
jgi:O-antigen/teichoic acid export membrane protein